MDYSALTLLFHPARPDGVYPVQVLEDTGKESLPEHELIPPVNLPDIRDLLRELGLRSLRRGNVAIDRTLYPVGPPDRIDRTARSTGHSLFEALFGGRVREHLEEALRTVHSDTKRGLRITLRLDPRETSLATVLHYPWELLHPPGRPHPLCLDPRTPVVRQLALDPTRELPPARRPLQVLAVASNPDRRRRLDLERELVELRRSLSGLAEVHHLSKPTHRALRDTLRDRSIHVVHFMGHGSFDPRVERGWLLLEDEFGEAHPISADTLGRALQTAPDLLLVVLNACESGTSPASVIFDPFAGVAPALVASGVPSVVAMQFTISDAAALQFSSALYTALGEGRPIEAAVTDGRMALASTRELSWEWATPVLYLQADNIRLPERVREARSTLRRPAPRRLSAPIDFSRLIQMKALHSLDRELAKQPILRFAQDFRSGYVLVRGAPGSGKTTLLADVTRQRGCVHHFDVRAEGVASPDLRVRNLAAQLVERYDLPRRYLDWATTADGGLARILARVAALLAGQEWIIIDLETPVARVEELGLPEDLPEGLIVLLGVAEERLLNTGVGESLSVTMDSLPDQADRMEEHLRSLARQGPLRSYTGRHGGRLDETLRCLVDQAGGSFLYLEFLVHELDETELAGQPPWELPTGLSGYLEWKWESLQSRRDVSWADEILPVLLALSPPHAPATLDEIAFLSGIGDRSRTRRVLECLVPLVSSRSVTRKSTGQYGYAISHEAVLGLVEAKEKIPAERSYFRTARLRLDRQGYRSLRHRMEDS